MPGVALLQRRRVLALEPPELRLRPLHHRAHLRRHLLRLCLPLRQQRLLPSQRPLRLLRRRRRAPLRLTHRRIALLPKRHQLL